MAINISHAPISAALAAGKKAGEGDDFRFRFGAGQQLQSAALQRRQVGNQENAQAIQQAQSSQAQAFGQSQALRQEALRANQGRAAAEADARKQKLNEERFAFEREKFGRQETGRGADRDLKQQKEDRLNKKPVDPTTLPQFKALAQITDPIKKQMAKIEDEIRKSEQGTSFADPAILQAQRQHLMTSPVKVGGQTMTGQELLDLENSMLAPALQMFQAADAAQQAAAEKASIEAAVDETVDELSAQLPPDTPTPDIARQVVAKMGKPTTPEEKLIIVDAINEIEQKIRIKAGQTFPQSPGTQQQMGAF